MGNPHVLTRRNVLAAAAFGSVGLAAACGDSEEERARASDDPVRTEMIADEQRLIDSYRAAIAAHPELESRLGPILIQHQAHALDLGGPPRPSGASDSPSSSWTTESAPAGAEQTVAMLRDAERRAAAGRIAGCTRAGTAELARLLSLIGASEAQHVAELTS